MTFEAYQELCTDIVSRPAAESAAPYDNPAYWDYTRMNVARMSRWLKTGTLTRAFTEAVKAISRPQQWLIITEPWCGDAAHNIPFLELAARQNPLITTAYELRDSEPFRINQYLTGTSKSIPKLVIRDEAGHDLHVWGPRPADCQVVYDTLHRENADFERIKTEIQQWYNANKGADLQAELVEMLNTGR